MLHDHSVNRPLLGGPHCFPWVLVEHLPRDSVCLKQPPDPRLCWRKPMGQLFCKVIAGLLVSAGALEIITP